MDSTSEAYSSTHSEPSSRPRRIAMDYLTDRNTPSTVHSIFRRELGFPIFSKSADSTSHHVNEALIGRQMTKARSLCGSIVTPTPVSIETQKGPDASKISDGRKWIQLVPHEKETVHLENGLFWVYQSQRVENGFGFKEALYVLEPDFTFKCFEKNVHQGKLTDFESVTDRQCTSTTNSTYILTLTEIGRISAIDIVKKRRVSELQLYSSLPDKVRFTQLNVESNTRRIFVVAAVAGYVRSIYVLSFPPWKILDIIQVRPCIRLELIDSMIFICNPGKIELHDLDTWLKSAEPTYVPIEADQEYHGEGGYLLKHIHFEKEITKKPAPLHCIPSKNEFFGILDAAYPPIYYCEELDYIWVGQFGMDQPLMKFPKHLTSISSIIPLPPESSSILLISDSSYIVLHYKQDYDTMSHSLNTSYPFNEEKKTDIPRPSSRPQRKASETKKNLNSTKILGCGCSTELGLIALCTDSGVYDDYFNVALYDSHSLKLVKKLQSVRIWSKTATRNAFGSRRRRHKSDSDSDSEVQICLDKLGIQKFVVEFEYDVLLISISYFKRPKHDVLLLRILEENASLTL